MSDPEPRATFDPALPTARDRMRFDLADTDVNRAKAETADPLTLPVDDAIYDGVLARRGNDERLALIDLADALYSRYAQEPSRAEISNVESAEWKNRLDGWKALATRLRGEIATETQQARGSFTVLRPTRPGQQPGGEYYAGGRCPIDQEW